MTESTLLTAQALVDGNNLLTETTIATTAFALVAELTCGTSLNLAAGAVRPNIWMHAVTCPDIGTFDATTLAQIRNITEAVKLAVPEVSGLIRSSKLPLTPVEGLRLYTWFECDHVISSTLTVTLKLIYV